MLPAGASAASPSTRCVLSRALYRCKQVALGHVAPSERRAVLRNLLLAWSPFERSEYRVAWQGTAALAVAWDHEAVDTLRAAAGIAATAALWPETFLRETRTSDGLRVLQCLEGVEAQLWRGASLQASRWWPRRPDAAEAELWLRSLGGERALPDALPAPTPAAWLRRPWAELRSLDDLLSTSSRLERIAVGAALVGFAALTGAQAHQALAGFEALQVARRDLERALLVAAPMLAARDRAVSLARDAEGLASQLTAVSPLELLQHLADALPARGATLKELELSGRQLRLALELAPDVPRSAVVRDLQAGAWLTQINEVRETAGRGWIVFEAVLAGPRAPAGAARPALAASAVLPAATLATAAPTPAPRSPGQP